MVGLRPGPGRIARGLYRLPFETSLTDVLYVEGPMARTARDCALMLDAMAGEDVEDMLSQPAPTGGFLSQLEATPAPRRVAFSPDLGGIVPVDSRVATICEAAAERFRDMGATVDEACPDLRDAVECFQVLRAEWFAAEHAGHLRHHREQLKPDVAWNIEKGLELSGAQIAEAEAQRWRMAGNALRFFEDYDLLLAPAAIVPPFEVGVRYVDEVAGHRFDNYVHWLAITFAITLTGCPAASAPAGLTDDGLPVGLQIVGPPRAEAAVLAAADRLDALTAFSQRLPVTPPA